MGSWQSAVGGWELLVGGSPRGGALAAWASLAEEESGARVLDAGLRVGSVLVRAETALAAVEGGAVWEAGVVHGWEAAAGSSQPTYPPRLWPGGGFLGGFGVSQTYRW